MLYWDQLFQPKPVLVDLVDVPNIEHFSNRFWLNQDEKKCVLFLVTDRDTGQVRRLVETTFFIRMEFLEIRFFQVENKVFSVTVIHFKFQQAV